MNDKPDSQTIEDAYKAVFDVVDRCGENTETRRARYHLEIAEGYTFEARERTQPCDD